MPTNILNAGGTGDAASLTGGDDGTLTIQTGPSGSKVNALVISSTGAMTTTDSAGVPKMLLRTAQNTTSGTAIDFTGIPSWAKKVTVMLNGVSTSGANHFLIQMGSGSVETTGYTSSAEYGGTATSSAAGFVAVNSGAAQSHAGHVLLTLTGTVGWVESNVIRRGDGVGTSGLGVGSKTFAGVIDRLRLTTVGGTDTFDAGSVNILIEGY